MRLLGPLKPPYDLRIVWVLVPFALLGCGLAMLPLRSWDYWWHIAFGRVISATGEMPLYNHFLYTLPAEAPSYVQAWLSQWTLYELHERVGMHGVLVLRNLIGAFAWLYLTLWAARRAGNVAVGSIAALSGAIFGFFCVAARTHLLAWPLFLVVVPLMYAVREKRLPTTALIILPAVSLAWVNLHGTFLVPTLVGIAFTAAEAGHLLLKRPVDDVDATRGRLAAFGGATLASFLATFANPRGAEVYLYLVDLPTNPENLATVTEWFPTTPFFPPFYGAYFWVIFVAVLALMFRQRDRIDLADLFLLVGFSFLAVRHSRALLWVGLTLPFVVPRYIAFLGRYFEADDAEPSRTSQAIHAAVAAGLVLMVFAVQPWSAHDPLPAQVQGMPTRTEQPLKGVVTADTPVEPVQILRGRDDLRIFHDARYPGFLLYSLDDEEPDQLVFVDNRIELPPGEVWRTYDAVSRGENWRETFEKYDVDTVVASVANQKGLIDAMRGAAGWEVEFENESYILIVREDSP